MIRLKAKGERRKVLLNIQPSVAVDPFLPFYNQSIAHRSPLTTHHSLA